MAPNRKQIAFALDPLVEKHSLVQAKYLPLTTEVAAPAAPAEPTVVRANNVDEDYWAWEAPAQEEKKDLFSASRMIEMEAARVASNAPVKTVASHDDYWAERVEARYSSENAAVSESTGYWEWPQEASSVQIALILKEEFARQQVSGERMEERLREEARTRKHYLPQDKAENDDYWAWETPYTVRAEPSEISDSYWEWDGQVKSEQTEREEMIASILAYEEARGLFSGEHIQEQLVQASQSLKEVNVNDANDSYWNWPAQEDDYWNMRPLPTAATAAPQGYWDW